MSDAARAGSCPRCGNLLEIHGTEPGTRSYWVCSDHRRPVVILPPENIGWAFAHAYTAPGSPSKPAAYDPETSFVDRFCDRLEMVYQGVREQNRARHLSRADRDDDGQQVGLEAFTRGVST